MSLKQRILDVFIFGDTKKSDCLRKTVFASAINLSTQDPSAVFFNGSSVVSCTNEVGNCGCIHAEPKAVLKLCQESMKVRNGFVMVCKYSPCTTCANLIMQCGYVGAIVYEILTEHDQRGLEILSRAGVEIITLDQVRRGTEDVRLASWWKTGRVHIRTPEPDERG